MTQSVTISLSGREYTVARARLGRYLDLQSAQERIDQGAADRDTGAIAEGLFAYIESANPEIERGVLESAPWFEVMAVYQEIVALNRIPESKKFAILQRIEDRRGRSVPWHFVGRSAFVWIHIIASAYHWSKSEIENLWPEEAIAYIQEITVDEQLEKEFLYSLSEIAYPYNPSTKKHKFVPMQRPYFMVAGGEGSKKKTKLLKSMMPQGKVIYPKDADESIKH